jgi:glycosyltransferase involved in cell wall biosynthesis
MNHQPKISVIIPIYNTGSYLDRCIKSVVDQTYKNLEIVLIDDGSTDNSAKICNDYEKIDKRVRYYYKDNGGVSSARNFGIKNAKGAYITFVDSDDIITKDAVSLLMMCNDSFDVSMVEHKTVSDNYIFINGKSKNNLSILTGLEATKKLLYESGMNNSVCGLVYRRNIEDDLLFNEDIAYGEDFDFKFKLLKNASKIVLNSSAAYIYITRDDSAMNTSFTTKRMDSLKVALSNLANIRKFDPPLIKAAKHKVFLESVSILRAIDHKKVHKSTFDDCILYIKTYRSSVIADKDAPLQHRIYAVISIVNIPILLWLIDLKNRLLKR